MSTEPRFWMVWRDDGQPPCRIHNSKKSAITEAQRLSKLHSGKKFYVLKAVEAHQVPEIQPVRIELIKNHLDDLPF